VSGQKRAISDGRTPEESYGIPDSRALSMSDTKNLDTTSAAVPKVIPFPILCLLDRVPAQLAAQLKSVNDGHIPQTFLLLPRVQNVKPSHIISKLRATLDLKNVRFSVRSVKKSRILLSAYYFKETTQPAKPAA
jgi:hypothetical protein